MRLGGAATGGGEPPAEAHRGRAAAGQTCVAGGGRNKVVSPQLRREAVLVIQVEVELCQRRACGLIGFHLGTCRYRSRRPEDGRLRARSRELAAVRRRFGYRRLLVLLQRGSWQVNHKGLYRAYVEEKLSLRRKRSRKRAGARQPLAEPTLRTRYPGTAWNAMADLRGRNFGHLATRSSQTPCRGTGRCFPDGCFGVNLLRLLPGLCN